MLKKDREIFRYTIKIAQGTATLAIISDEEFTKIYKTMEERKVNNPMEYKIPEWFTIKFVKEKGDLYKFIGSFQHSEESPIIYKKYFIKLLDKLNINYEKIDKDTYKIIRKPSIK